MKPVNCIVPHNPPFSHGDCLRACVASLLEQEPDQVPHFAKNGDGDEQHALLIDYLAKRQMVASVIPFGGEMTLGEVCRKVVDAYGSLKFILMCSTIRDVNHAVICSNGRVLHDPAKYKNEILKPVIEHNHWFVIILANVAYT